MIVLGRILLSFSNEITFIRQIGDQLLRFIDFDYYTQAFSISMFTYSTN